MSGHSNRLKGQVFHKRTPFFISPPPTLARCYSSRSAIPEPVYNPESEKYEKACYNQDDANLQRCHDGQRHLVLREQTGLLLNERDCRSSSGGCCNRPGGRLIAGTSATAPRRRRLAAHNPPMTTRRDRPPGASASSLAAERSDGLDVSDMAASATYVELAKDWRRVKQAGRQANNRRRFIERLCSAPAP
jgi:hypothetical protein